MQSDIIDEKPATKKDIETLQQEVSLLKKKISVQLASKADLRRETKALWQEALRLEEKIEKLEETMNRRFDEMTNQYSKLEGKVDTFKDEIMNKLDYIIGELQTMREENTVGAYQIQELRERMDGFEKRLHKLEQH